MTKLMCIHCPAVVKETDTTCVFCGGQLKDKEQGNEQSTSSTNRKLQGLHAPRNERGRD